MRQVANFLYAVGAIIIIAVNIASIWHPGTVVGALSLAGAGVCFLLGTVINMVDEPGSI
jgi:hypothetical protein